MKRGLIHSLKELKEKVTIGVRVKNKNKIYVAGKSTSVYKPCDHRGDHKRGHRECDRRKKRVASKSRGAGVRKIPLS